MTEINAAQLRKWILVGLGVGTLVSLLLGILLTEGDWGGLLLNLGAEFGGALATYVLLELFIGRRERHEAEEKELEAKKADLIAKVGSRVNDVAVAAAEELRRHGWLYDGSLRGAILNGANLQGAFLYKANLEGTQMEGANLQGAYLVEANLQGANLLGAKLQGAKLQETSLEGAFMVYANLEGADLCATNLRGAAMSGAKMQRANFNEIVSSSLDGTITHRYTILPDGTKWTPGTDMARFTDYTRPDQWRPARA